MVLLAESQSNSLSKKRNTEKYSKLVEEILGSKID
jgi:hypothetical protein